MGILTSDTINALSWEAEVFYRRLQSVADDYGRYDGRVSVLRSMLYPLKIDQVSTSQVQAWLEETVKTGAVRLYEVEGKPFVEVLRFKQRIRSDSKWPSPTNALPTTSTHTTTTTNTSAGDGKPLTYVSKVRTTDRFEEFWKLYPKKAGKGYARKAWQKLTPSNLLQDQILLSLKNQLGQPDWKKLNGQYIPHPATWLNGERWLDEKAQEAHVSDLTPAARLQLARERDQRLRGASGQAATPGDSGRVATPRPSTPEGV